MSRNYSYVFINEFNIRDNDSFYEEICVVCVCMLRNWRSKIESQKRWSNVLSLK